MKENGFVWAFSEQNPSYKRLTNKRKKEEKKNAEIMIKCIFRDNGELITVEIQKQKLGEERLKHDELVTTYDVR